MPTIALACMHFQGAICGPLNAMAYRNQSMCSLSLCRNLHPYYAMMNKKQGCVTLPAI